MNDIAIIENDTIINVIVADLAWAQGAFSDSEVLTLPEGASIGWVRENGVFAPVETPAVEPTPVTHITRRQGLLALLTEQGVEEGDVNAVIDSIDDPLQQKIARIEFASNNWEIYNPLIMQLAESLGITSERLQELFNIADTI